MRFATDFELTMWGEYRSVASVTTAGKYVSPLVVTTMFADVALFFRMPFPLTSFASNAKLLMSLGLRVVTFAPRFEIALHQKFPAGLPPSLSVVPFSDALSPVSPESPS